MVFKRLSLSFSFLLALCLAPGMAQATLVIDTGTPSNAIGTGWAFNGSHSYAGRFSLSGEMTLDGIEGYFSTAPGSAGISLFSNSDDGDGGFVPGSALYTSSFATAAGPLAWNGVSALNWHVSPGTYWIVFTSTYGTAGQTSMPGLAGNPLDGYALTQGGHWYDAAGLGLAQGLRIDARADVPEPGSMALFGLGLIAIGVSRRSGRA